MTTPSRCPICAGRTVLKESGLFCMNARCDGSQMPARQEGMVCTCGQPMQYTHSNAYGDMTYACVACGETAKH